MMSTNPTTSAAVRRRTRSPRHTAWQRALRLATLAVAAVGLLTLAAPSTALAGPNTAEAIKLFDSGQYDAAVRLLTTEVEREPDNLEARLALARAFERTGRYTEMAEHLEIAAEDDDVGLTAKIMLAENDIRVGNYDDGRKKLEKILKKDSDSLRALARLGEVYYTLGRKNDGDRTMNAFAPVFNQGKAETAEALTLVGVAMQATDSFEDANYAFSEAMRVDDTYVDAYVHSGLLFLEKYNYRDADQMFRKALELDPNHPEALVGMARTAIDSDHAYDEARGYLEQALTINPSYVPAMQVQVELQLADEMVDAALTRINDALAVNPNDLHTLALKATAHYLADDAKSQKAVEKQILKLNERYADLYVTMASFGEIAHRYEEGIALYEKALKLDSTHWETYVGLGIAYTRIGDDEKGSEYLEKAFDADPYNVRAFNLVELYDQTLKHYDWVESDTMRYRFHRNEKDLLELYIPALMDGAYGLYERKYGFAPAKGLSVEVFSDLTSFSVRSVGLPAISPQGICFGKVITARSPIDGNFNWAQTMWHELAHVFHIQLSDSRVPRWFTEGLAEYETIVARKEWQREHEVELWLAHKAHKIYGVDELNYAFTHAENLHQVVVAYYQASLVIEYIDKTYGFDKLVAMLQGWGDHKTQPEIFQEVLGVTTAEFDQGFKTWLDTRLGFLEKSYELDLNGYVLGYQDFIDAANAAPDDANALADAGLAELFQLRVDNARSYMTRSLAADANNVRANYLGGIIALREGAYEQALEYYNKLNELGIDGYTIQSELGFLHLKLGKTDEAIKHYEAAKAFYPRGQEPYRELTKLYMARDDKRAVRRELETLVEIDQNDYAVASQLLAMALKAGEHDDARDYGEAALNIYPFDSELHLQMAEIGVKQQDWLLAEREYKAWLVLEPGDPLEGYLGLASVYVELGQPNTARDYIERARAVKPNDPRISSVEAKIK